MATPILNITELADGQVNNYSTSNTGVRALESASNDFLTVDLSAGSVTLTSAQYRGYVVYRSSGNTVARDLTLAAIKRLCIVHNNSTAILSVKMGTATVPVPPAATRLIYTDGTANGILEINQGRSYAASLTAFAGGGQGSATALISEINHIGTCATAGDSVKLLAASPGLIQRIINRGAAACDVFPNTGGNLGAGTNTAISLAAGAGVTYACYSSTGWDKV